jgi:hypothetical protein
VQADAPVEVLKASYRALMHQLRMHPDLGGDHERAAVINEAFAVLSNPVTRAEYDRRLKRPERGRGPLEQTPPAPPAETPFGTPYAQEPATQPPSPPTLRCSFCQTPCSSTEASWPEATCSSCDSPLFPARRHRDGSDARRAIERVSRHMPVTFWLPTAGSRRQVGITEDLSLNGMRFVSVMEIPIGARIRVECDFCAAVGIVRGMRPDPGHPRTQWQCGLEFVTLRFKRERGGLFSTVG